MIKDLNIAEDHGFLVQVIGDMARKLRKDGKLLATDRTVFAGGLDKDLQAQMPTLLELLEGYFQERT